MENKTKKNPSREYRADNRPKSTRPAEQKPAERRWDKPDDRKPKQNFRSDKPDRPKKNFYRDPSAKPNAGSRAENPRAGRKDAFADKPFRAPESEIRETEESVHGDYENGAVIGRNAVRELLRSERPVDKLFVQRGERTGSIVVLVAQAVERGIPVIEVEKAKLDAIADFAPHQGVIAFAAEKEYCTVEDILQIAKERNEAPLIVLCDGVTDPYNLGAIIRCAECCGAHGLIIPKRRAAGLTPLVTKASAGAIEHLAIAKVANIASTVELLKKQGVWVYAAEADGTFLSRTDLSGPCAIVMGSEGEGVSQLVRKTCDGVISIPIYGKVNSFNVSTAAAIILAEAARQHHPDN